MVALVLRSKSRAVDHEGTKGGEGQIKTFMSNQQTQSLYINCLRVLSFLRVLCQRSGFVVALVLRSKSRAVNHEGTKGEEGKLKTFMSN